MTIDKDNSQILEVKQSILKRPGMHFGSIYHHRVLSLLKMILECSFKASKWVVKIHENNRFEIIDDGVGISFSSENDLGIPYVQAALTTFGELSVDDPQSIGLMDSYSIENGRYVIQAGYPSCGLHYVNTVSYWVEVKSRRDCSEYFIRTENSEVVESRTFKNETKLTGTSIKFELETRFFSDEVNPYLHIGAMMIELRDFAAFRCMSIRVEDWRKPSVECFEYNY